MPQTDRSDIFLSYRRADVEFTKQLEKALRATGREIWVDWEDIPPGIAGFTDEIVRGIDGADAFICVLSPSYMQSEYCLMELEQAVRSNKRVIPVVLQKFDGNPPSGIGHINWVYFTPHAGQENTFDEAMPKVIEALEADFEHARAHTRYMLRAKEWDDKKRQASFLMDGAEVDESEKWLTRAAVLNPPPLAIHTEYILASRQLETQKQRQARIYLSIGLGVSVLLLIAALVMTVLAEANRREAEAANEVARAALENAETQTRYAEETALLSNSQLTLYRDSNSELALALALRAHEVGMLAPEEYRVLSEAAYAPGTHRVMTGHTKAVYGLVLTSDGKRAVSASEDSTIRVWDVATGELLNTFPADDPETPDFVEGHTGIIWDIAVSSDDKFVASAAADSTVRVWDLATGEMLQTINAGEGIIYAVAISPNNDFILSASENVFSVQLWDAKTGELVRELVADNPETDGVEGHGGIVRDIAFNKDNRTVITGGNDGRALVWNWTDGELLRKLLPGGQIYAVLFDKDSNRAFTAGNDKMIRYWNLVSAQQFPGIFEGHSAYIYGIALSPDGSRLISASQDLSLRLWDVTTRKELRRFVGHGNYAFKAAFLPGGKQFISASFDSTLRVWDIETQEYLDQFEGHEGTIFQLNFNKAGDKLLSAAGDRTIRLWDTATNSIIQTFGVSMNEDAAIGHTNLVTNAKFNADETQIITTGYDNTVRVWDVKTGELLHTLPADIKETEDVLEGHSSTAWSVTFLPDGKHVLSGGFDKRIILWNLETDTLEHVFEGHTDGVLSLQVIDGGKQFLSSSWDKTAILWDVTTQEQIRQFKGHTNWIWNIAIAPDEKTFLTSSADQTMILWDIATGQPIRRFLGHDDSVLSAAFSPDGKLAVSSGRDNKVLLWDIDSGMPMRRFLGHSNWVRAIAFSPDGKTLVTGGNDRIILRWQIQSLDELIAWTKAHRYIRDLTCGERDRYNLPACEISAEELLAPTPTPEPVS